MKKKRQRNPVDENKVLSSHMKWYWKDPDHARALQRAKYRRYPEKIKAIAKNWQKKNPEKWKILCRFNSRIWYWKRIKGDIVKARYLEKAKEKALRELEMGC